MLLMVMGFSSVALVSALMLLFIEN